MAVADRLACALGRRDEVPNVKLAVTVAARGDRAAMRELVSLVDSGHRDQRSDAIKVLYEIGDREPSLIAPYVNDVARWLADTTQRIVWGAMTALHTIADHDPSAVAPHFSTVRDVAKRTDSVIARDHAVGVFAALTRHAPSARAATAALLDALRTAPDNQFPAYAEIAVEALGISHTAILTAVLTTRIPSLTKESQKRRVERALRSIEKMNR